MASFEALSWMKVKRKARDNMLTAGVIATEQYLALPSEERTVPPEEDPNFLKAQAVYAEAQQRLSEAAINSM